MALLLFLSSVFAAFLLYEPLNTILNLSAISRGIFNKISGLKLIVDAASDKPWAWLFGLGPGNSISRVALMSIYSMPDSPVNLLGLSSAPTTTKIFELFLFDRTFGRSSAWSGISSWSGIFGDLGLVGIGLYLWMGYVLWRNLKAGHGWKSAAAKSILIMACLLGISYSWLEEPGFTLTSALAVSLGLIDGKQKEATPRYFH